MVVLWGTGMQPRPKVDKGFMLALMPVALFHTIGHVSACVSFSQVRAVWLGGDGVAGRLGAIECDREGGCWVDMAGAASVEPVQLHFSCHNKQACSQYTK
jgi:hypothetical protein